MYIEKCLQNIGGIVVYTVWRICESMDRKAD